MFYKMLIFYVLCYFTCIQYIYGSIITSETRDLSSKIIRNESHYNKTKTKLDFISEGGSLLPDTAVDIVKLPKDKLLLSLDNEMGKNKEKSVVPRKGVVYNSVEDIHISRNTTDGGKNDTSIVHKTLMNSKENIFAFTKPPVSKIITNETSQQISAENKTKAEVPKKPLVLSNAALDQISFVNYNQTSFPINGHKTKVLKNPNSHPGMIMPIVITILVVPMFAVIGYLALKEAKKLGKIDIIKEWIFFLMGCIMISFVILKCLFVIISNITTMIVRLF